jgi:hypothetical protein
MAKLPDDLQSRWRFEREIFRLTANGCHRGDSSGGYIAV